MLGQQGARHDWTERNSTVRDRNEERPREAMLRYPYCYGGNPGIYHARLRAIQLDMGHYNLDSMVTPYCERELRCQCGLFGDDVMPSGMIRFCCGLGCIAGASRRNGCGQVRVMDATGVSHDGVVIEAPSISIGGGVEVSPRAVSGAWGRSGVATHKGGYRFATESLLGE